MFKLLIARAVRIIKRVLNYVHVMLLRGKYKVRSMDDYYREKKKIEESELPYEINLGNDELIMHENNMKYLRTLGNLVRHNSWLKEKKKEQNMLETAILSKDIDEDFFKQYEEEITYLRKCGDLRVFPYEFTEKYFGGQGDIDVKHIEGLKYVLHRGERLFFPPYPDGEIQNMYAQLAMEQDVKSPHRYFSDVVNFDGGIFVDVGSAEGIISLDVVKQAREVYLLERSSEWIDALQKTFENHAGKIHIVQKYAGCSDGEETISLDTLLENYENENIFIKMDVEGMEMEVLRGCIKTLERNNCKLACTCYHTNSMEEKLKHFFKSKGYNVETSEGYMLFIHGDMTLKNGMYEQMEYPFFRRGLVRAYKSKL